MKCRKTFITINNFEEVSDERRSIQSYVNKEYGRQTYDIAYVQ
jgi:hypothetical protein